MTKKSKSKWAESAETIYDTYDNASIAYASDHLSVTDQHGDKISVISTNNLSYSFKAEDIDFKITEPIDYKFDEKKYLNELTEYVNATYSQHYSQNKFQSTEVIMDRGHGTGFCMGNVDKYSNRYGKKGSKADARKDLLKVIHYAMLQLYVHDNDLG